MQYAPKVDPAIFRWEFRSSVSVMAFKQWLQHLQGVVAQTGKSEFGRTPLSVMSWL
jgi:GMP synthase (glutamine-hydrolysing)